MQKNVEKNDGEKSEFLTFRFFDVFLHAKKNEKNRKKGGPSGLHGRGRRSCGGRREGKEGYCVPSGTADLRNLKQTFRTTPAPRWGTANLNRCARLPYPRGTPESGLPRLDAEPGKIPQNPRRPDKSLTEPAEKYREILAKCGPGGSPEPPESLRELTGAHPSDKNAKKQKTVAQRLRCRKPWDLF